MPVGATQTKIILEEFIMAKQTLIGQVYSVEGFDYKKNGEDRRRVVFRLGMDKPYKVEKKIDGENKQVREKTFITAKCFNGLSESIEEYFGGEDNKGRWIMLTGHYETEEFEKTVEIDHPEDEDVVIELPVKTQQLVFMVDGFSFIGPAPEGATPSKPKEKKKKTVQFKKKSEKGKPSADDAQKELQSDAEETEDAPF